MNSPDATEATYVDPVTSFMLNLMTGMVMCGFGVMFLFCFWPIGALLILGGLIAPFYLMTVKTLQGPCPFCGYKVQVEATKPGVTCRACKKRILVRSKWFVRVE
jgi:DNA-directed RNA polymerase subunit RPC12/RpoP